MARKTPAVVPTQVLERVKATKVAVTHFPGKTTAAQKLKKAKLVAALKKLHPMD